MKKAVSIIMAIAMLMSMATASYANSYNLDLPTTSEWTGRRSNFNGTIDGYSPSTVTAGGTAIPSSECLELTRTTANGELYWQDYVNSTYGVGDGYLTLKLKKNVATAGAIIHTAGGGYTVMLNWAGDGKLYAKNRANASSGDASNWNYIATIDGLEAEITTYIYTDKDYYAVAVNGELVSSCIYSMSANPTKSELVRVTVEPGEIDDKISIDYKACGSITANTLIPAGVVAGVSNDGNVTVTQDFVGYNAAKASALNMYSAVYDINTSKLVSVAVTPIADAIVQEGTSDFGSVTQSTSAGGYTGAEIYTKNFIWSGEFAPIAPETKAYFLTPPVKTSVINETNGLRHGSVEGTDYGEVVYDGTSMTITRGVDTPEGTTQYMASTNYNNGASYSVLTDGVMNFNLTKSNKDFEAHFVGLPCNYVDLSWKADGSFWACYRDSAEQDGTTAEWKKLGYSTDALSVNVTVAYNGGTSSYSLWIDDVPVVVNKYSRAVYAGAHNVPDKISQVRIYTERGKAGDVLKLSDFKFYKAAGYGD